MTKINVDKIANLHDEINGGYNSKNNTKSYNNWNTITILLQILNIVLCYFGISTLFANFINGFNYSTIIVALLSIVTVSIWEYLKRVNLRKTLLDFFSNKKILNTNTLFTSIFVLGSILIAVYGGKELSDNRSNIQNNYTNISDSIVNSITIKYDTLISKNEIRSDYIYSTAIDNNGNKRSLNKIESAQLNQLFASNKILLENKSTELKNISEKYNNKILTETNKTYNIVIIFIIITLLFESLIFMGINNNAKFDYKLYIDSTNNSTYQKYLLYDKYLNILYNNGSYKINEMLMTEANFSEIVKIKIGDTSSKNIKDFFIIITGLGLIEKNGRGRSFKIAYNDACEKIKEILN